MNFPAGAPRHSIDNDNELFNLIICTITTYKIFVKKYIYVYIYMVTSYFKLTFIIIYEKNISCFQKKIKYKTRIINIILYYIVVKVITNDTTV